MYTPQSHENLTFQGSIDSEIPTYSYRDSHMITTAHIEFRQGFAKIFIVSVPCSVLLK